MDSCKIPLGESKWIHTLGREFQTLYSGIVLCIQEKAELKQKMYD